MHTYDRYAASIIVPSYNRSNLLEYTLDSCRNSSVSPDSMEVVVVDDGSSDDTFDCVRKFQDSLNIKYIYQDDRGYRLSRARNLGVRAAEGKICIFVDTGVLVARDCIAQHLAFHERSPDSVVIGYVYGFSQSDDDAQGLLDCIDPRDVEKSIARLEKHETFLDIRDKCYRLCDNDISRLPAPWSLAWGCNMSLARSDIVTVGGYDENYMSWGAEDIDFGISQLKQGLRFALERSAQSIHYPHEKSEEINRISLLENKAYLHRKYQMEETRLLTGMSAIELNLHLLSITPAPRED